MKFFINVYDLNIYYGNELYVYFKGDLERLCRIVGGILDCELVYLDFLNSSIKWIFF